MNRDLVDGYKQILNEKMRSDPRQELMRTQFRLGNVQRAEDAKSTFNQFGRSVPSIPTTPKDRRLAVKGAGLRGKIRVLNTLLYNSPYKPEVPNDLLIHSKYITRPLNPSANVAQSTETASLRGAMGTLARYSNRKGMQKPKIPYRNFATGEATMRRNFGQFFGQVF
jgi:hypothetical protein